MNERLSFNSDIWGPKAWFFLDTIILSYPDIPTHRDMIIYKNFYNNLSSILPCIKCAEHYTTNLQKYPLTTYILSSKYKLIRWWLKMHNAVRIKSNKKVIEINKFIDYYTDHLNLYDHINSYKDYNNNYFSYVPIYILIALSIIILLLIYKK